MYYMDNFYGIKDMFQRTFSDAERLAAKQWLRQFENGVNKNMETTVTTTASPNEEYKIYEFQKETLGKWGTFAGLKLIESNEMVDTMIVRRSKKKRLNKKLNKRYGLKRIVMPKKELFFMEDKVIGHPITLRILKERINIENVRG